MKGHWPKGKRRKPFTGIGVAWLLRSSVNRRGLRPTARILGCDAHTVKRWMTGERFPNREEVSRIQKL